MQNTVNSTIKIFCVGFNKTGTTSLHQAFTTLGLSSLHWSPEGDLSVFDRREIAHSINRNMDIFKQNGMPLLTMLGDYQAFSDVVGVQKHWQTLAEQYPDSLFILNTRSDVEAWIKSRLKHHAREEERSLKETGKSLNLNNRVDHWRENWVKHHEKIEAYFADQKHRLLRISVPDGEGYEKLCPFLGLPVPDTPFPSRNKTADIQKNKSTA